MNANVRAMDQDTPSESPRLARIELDGNEFAWNLPAGLYTMTGHPSISIWIETSLAGLMHGMQRMVGTERFNLAMQGGGRDSIEGDWEFVCGFPSFEVGFERIAAVANTCGWGLWELAELDRETKLGRFRVTNGWEPLYQRALGEDWGSSFIAGKFAGLCSRLFETNCWATQTVFQTRGAAYDEFEVRPSTRTIEQEIEGLLHTDKATRADLAIALQRLQREVEERKRAEREAKERLAVIEAQRRDLDALGTPILRVGKGVLALPILGSITSDRAVVITERLLDQIRQEQARYAIIDVTGVTLIDTDTANHLIRLTRTVGLLGARCIITGIRPAIAQTLVALDADFGELVLLATLRDGLDYCANRR